MHRLLLTLAFSLLCALPVHIVAAGTLIEQVQPVAADGRLFIDADVDFTLTDELRGVAEKGVPLYFTADLELKRPRWWWFDETVTTAQITWRIQYNTLTRQWRTGSGELSLPASTLDEALDMVRHIRGWDVAALAAFDTDTDYQGRLRLRLDTARLARPFQVDALNSKAWSLSTPWKEFTFSISGGAPRP